MSSKTPNILENKFAHIDNYYSENTTRENKINDFFPIKKIQIKKTNDISYKALTQKSNNYLKNLEVYKNLPESIISNIIQSKQYISPNHNILFHHYSKEKNKKNSIRIQSIIINSNLGIINKEEKNVINIIKTEPNTIIDSKLIYHKKNIPKSKSTINSNKQSKKNNNTTQSSILANYETNYDYDYDNNNYVNFNNDNYYEKFNLFEKKNNFTDITLKEYLNKETKLFRTAFNYYENKEKNKKSEETKVQDTPSDKPKIERNVLDVKVKEYENKVRKNSFSKSNNNNFSNNKNREKNKSQENINSYTNRFKMKKNRTKLQIGNNNLVHKILTKISYDFLSSKGNFISANSKRKSFIIEDEKNNNNTNKFNIFENTKNFYNDAKIDYSSFRKNNLNNNKKLSKQKNKNILILKEEKKIPFKLTNKDLNYTSKRQLISDKKFNSSVKRNNSLDRVNKNYKFIPNSDRRIYNKKK